MRVVHIVESFGGGVYSYFKDLAHFFSKVDDIETIIIYSNNRKEVSEEQIKNDFPKNITMICVEMQRELKPIKDIKATLKLRNLLKSIKPDVVHLHSSKAGVIGRWATTFMVKRKAIYYTPHGYSFLRLDISPLKRKIFYNIEKFTQLLFGGTTIACGDTEYNIARKIGKSMLVRNGINLDKLSKYYIPKINNTNTITIGTIGRIMPQKNPQLFNQIAETFPKYRFIWIGDGDQKELLTASNIIVTGWIHNQTDLYDSLNSLDVYIQTSLWEGLPIAVLEAMAFHKPIVATNVIGNKDIVQDSINGYLFEKVEDLVPLVHELENSSLRAKLGTNAYIDCTNKYNKETNFTILSTIYTESLNRL
ncbi:MULTISPECIES: glycosyltransferase [Myroides]|uniref:Glycosyltransferase n=1 Tax=Myroides albus TaxID=2562892 RepID=A0A6I3LK98_9FLAO|nr:MULTISPECIES: glycosyltransferase [Myroides]MTG96572.1 glycosyltransferase [Myroides albus]MVX34568.1 glycosyltransferase [Myroides sp. LoEW2-1]UVD81014.1 glycosyltransferase [Myroides albus]